MATLKFITSVVILLSTLSVVYNQDKTNVCTSKTTCGDCITSNPSCAWCKQEDYDRDRSPRCDVLSKILENCEPKQVVNPVNRMTKNLDKKLSYPGAKITDVVQIAPQAVSLGLRPGEPFPLHVEFRQAEDYPVDLYYLMDLSKSMEDDKDKLALLGDLLAERMNNITKNFRLGFGSFVDKVVMPYVSTVPEKLKEPCTKCAAPYGFINHMPLNDRTDRFKEEVSNAQVSGNLDAPEGGFDAIMQSMVCPEIGWRSHSRKLLVFSTDSGFHYAGDGKLGGIVKPNDGLCHLDDKGMYTQSIHQDYPSLSQLNQKAIKEKVHMIFAVTANQVPVYTQLSENLEGSTTGKLENDSSNVVDLVKGQYDKITSTIELKDTASTEYLSVTYYSKCTDGKRLEKTSICKGLKVGTTVSFEVNVEVKKCPKNRDEWKQTFTISPVGLKESLLVKLEMLCECKCETPIEEERNSASCSKNGTYECGVCNCNTNRYGRKCECDLKTTTPEVHEALCMQNGTNQVCSGRGQCVCGICDCSLAKSTFQSVTDKVYGKYCECDNFSCDRHDNKICNDRGKCDCGKCICELGWKGDKCECQDSNDTCINPDNKDVICSGNGVCECGRCKCFDSQESGRYFGQFCEECATCSLKCGEYKSCVQCIVFNSGELTEEECNNCSIKPDVVDKAEKETDTERVCVYKDDDDCKFTFVYGFNERNMPYVRVQRTKDCPPPVNILMIVLGVIGGIVAIGLCLLLIWKLLTTIHDRREFAKFEKERQMAKWDTGENPIFKQATSTFKNPTYGGK